MSSPSASRPSSDAPLYAAAAAVAVLLYLRTLAFGLTYLDDNLLVLGNLHFLTRPGALWEAFRQDVFHVGHGPGAYYRPLFTASLIMDARLWGTWLGGYHLTNVLIHAAGSGLALAVLRSLGYGRGEALFWGLAFAASPVLSQAACLITTRDDAVKGVFVFGSFWGFLRYLETGKARELAWHGLAFAGALFAKESSVGLAPACFLYTALLRRELMASRRMAALAAVWAAAGAAWFLMRRSALQRPLSMDAGQILASLWESLPGLIQLVGKSVFPFNLSVLPHQADTTLWWGIAALLAIAAAVLAAPRRRGAMAVFGAAWLLLFTLPSMTLQATTMAGVVMEKRMYAPLLGLLIALAETRAASGLDAFKPGPWARAGIILGAYALLAFRASAPYRDKISYWTNAAANSPTLPLAHRNLGAMLYLDGRIPEAEVSFRRSLALNPREPMARNNLGLIEMARGRLAEAQSLFVSELSDYPTNDLAYLNLGLAYARGGRPADAEKLWKRALELNPDNPAAYEYLARLYRAQGRSADGAAVLARMRGIGLPVPPDLR